MKLKKKSIILLALTVALVLAASIQSATAYFTTYAQARGGYLIDFGGDIHMDEEVIGRVKHLVIYSDPGADPVYVRARGYAGLDPVTGEDTKLSYSSSSAKWVDGGDGWWYYTEPLYGGSTLEELLVEIKFPTYPEGETPDPGEEFHVVVYYQYVPAMDGNGRLITPYTNAWTQQREG